MVDGVKKTGVRSMVDYRRQISGAVINLLHGGK